MSQATETMNNDPRVIVKNLKESIVEGLPFLALLTKRLMVAINKLPQVVQIVVAPIAEQAQARTAEMILQYESVSLTPLLSNLAVSTTNTVNLMFNSIKMAEATN